jgi:hypothetical protein
MVVFGGNPRITPSLTFDIQIETRLKDQIRQAIQHGFGRRFGIEKVQPVTAENSLNFFNLRAITTGITRAVNP